MAIGEVLLGAFLGTLFNLMSSRQVLDFARREKLQSLLEGWEKTLQDIHAVLGDAEDKALAGDDTVQPWLNDLRDLAYDVEDVLDEFATEEGLRNRNLSVHSTSSEVSGFVSFPSCMTELNPRRLVFYHKMRSKAKKISRALRGVVARKEELGLMKSGGGRFYMTSPIRSSSDLAAGAVFGREDDKRVILDSLMTDDYDLTVIPIVGMGGVGKTTLTQSIYNDAAVVRSFNLRAWAFVSNHYDALEITRSVLQSVTEGACVGTKLSVLQRQLENVLSGEKFLIVLDDFWNENYNDWTELQKPFTSGAKGSKIIVTTRDRRVASIMQTVPVTPYQLNGLSHSDCLSLFAYHTLGVGNFDAHPHLRSVGEKIVGKCGGLPLAATTLAGLLRFSYEISEWEDLATSEIWNLPGGTMGIPRALNLSYIHLPSHLKRCFAYCAAFPKDYEFDEQELVLLWMAEGLLGQPNPKTSSTLDLGRKYFHELFHRSFFQQSSRDCSLFVMHDLLNELATSVAGETCLRLGDCRVVDLFDGSNRQRRVRHLSLISHRHEISMRFEGCHEFKGLRSFLALDLDSHATEVSLKVIDDLLRDLKSLRAISLHGYQIPEVPNCIGGLKHLRYLNLTRSLIAHLPESMSNLYNLETLILKECERLVDLPCWINKLINLRYLDISRTPLLGMMPVEIGDLRNLDILSDFIVGGGDGGLRLRELKSLPNIQKELTISGLHNVGEAADAKDANLNAKRGLNSLVLKWKFDRGPDRVLQDMERELQVLNLLQPHTNLKHLEIDGFGGVRFSPWMGSPSFVNLERLKLCNCRKTETLPSFGLLPRLKEVEIEGMDAVCAVGPEFGGTNVNSFRCLETLKFNNMSAWELWSFSTFREGDIEPFPLLRTLKLQDCPRLAGKLPTQLRSLVKLEIMGCPALSNLPSTPKLSSLHDLRLEDCKGGILRSLVNTSSASALTKVHLTRISQLSVLRDVFVSCLVSLEELNILQCNELVRLWEIRDGALESFDCRRLKHLSVKACPQLVNVGLLPLSVESLTLEGCDSLGELPHNLRQHREASLRVLNIKRCSKLESITEGTMVCSLEELRIEGCDSLASFSGAKLPSMLKMLEISNCKKLQTLPDGIVLVPDDESPSRSQIEVLEISGCPSLLPFPTPGKLVPSLRSLVIVSSEILGSSLEGIMTTNHETSLSLQLVSISGCKMIERLTLQSMHRLARLTSLVICNCPFLELECIPEPPNSLQILHLERCDKIKSLPQEMHAHTSLRHLTISYCSGIKSFPEEGLPLNLESIWLEGCQNLNQPMSGWGLHRLTSLQKSYIRGKIGCLEGVTSFPPPSPGEGWHLLPSTITELHISRLSSLVTISAGLRGHLTSLQTLRISSCTKLRSLPRDGFPASLEQLEIINCSERLPRAARQYSTIVERIPDVRIEALRAASSSGCSEIKSSSLQLLNTNSSPFTPVGSVFSMSPGIRKLN